MPLNSKLMPTNVPTAHKELDGQRKKMSPARSRENQAIHQTPDCSGKMAKARKEAISKISSIAM